MSFAVRTCKSLGLGDSREIAALDNRQAAFTSIHMGTSEISVGRLAQLIYDEPGLSPPRSGHLGNWQDIERGRAGALDFNKAICGSGLGHPYVHAFTRTEADDGTGDWVYMPGSVVNNGNRAILPLYTWNGKEFTLCDRKRALFCPFVMAEVDGSLTPLISLHRERMNTLNGFHFRFEAELVVERNVDTVPLLCKLMDLALRSENPTRALSYIIGSAATPGGLVSPAKIEPVGDGVALNGCFYTSIESFVHAALVPCLAVAEPVRFVDRVERLPAQIPVLSHTVLTVLSAIFAAHFPGLSRDQQAAATRPFNAHLHWGARDMAGYPPSRYGYFMERSNQKGLRQICNALTHHFPEIDPVCVILLPASIFMLCPTSAHPDDLDMIAELFRLLPDRVGQSNYSAMRSPQVATITKAWYRERGRELSTYFRNRFRPRSGLERPPSGHFESTPIQPAGFCNIGLDDACAMVGALAEIGSGGEGEA